jgi:ArsR family transcriptional regulator
MARSSDIPGTRLRSLEKPAELLRVLGHPLRLKLIELVNMQAYSVGELAELLDEPPHVISQHLNLMRRYGLMDKKRDGRVVHYRVVHPSAMGVLRCVQRQIQTEATFQDGEAI